MSVEAPTAEVIESSDVLQTPGQPLSIAAKLGDVAKTVVAEVAYFNRGAGAIVESPRLEDFEFSVEQVNGSFHVKAVHPTLGQSGHAIDVETGKYHCSTRPNASTDDLRNLADLASAH